MTKRRNDDEGFANVLRQKPKEDLALKQEIGNKKQMQQTLFVDFFYAQKSSKYICYVNESTKNHSTTKDEDRAFLSIFQFKRK